MGDTEPLTWGPSAAQTVAVDLRAEHSADGVSNQHSQQALHMGVTGRSLTPCLSFPHMCEDTCKPTENVSQEWEESGS